MFRVTIFGRIILLVSSVLFLSVNKVSAEEIKLAVASNFKVVMDVLVSDFEQSYPEIDVVLVSGSSGKLYAQIKYGAPFDVFLSADQDKVERLIKEGLAFPESRMTYALGSLVLWSALSNLIDGTGQVLRQNHFNKLALANSKLAPYGLAAEQVLNSMHLEGLTRSKWVQGENIAQTYQFIETGNADIGFIAQSQVWQNGQLRKGSMWLVPIELYSPIQQDAVVLKRVQHESSAKLLLKYLQRPATQKKIEAYGYQAFTPSLKIKEVTN